MSTHLAIDSLSALVDGALGWAERLRAESHLAECGACRTRLEGLRAVADALGELPREAAPRALDLLVAPRRPLQLAGRETARRRPPALASTPLLVPFAGIVAITVILLLLAAVRPGAPPPVEPAPSAPRKLVLRSTTAGEVAPAPAWRRLDGRLYARNGSLWREIDGPAVPSRPAGPEERREILAARPELAAQRSAARWEVVWRGERLWLEPVSPGAPPGAQEAR